jgi:hypothetical protein
MSKNKKLGSPAGRWVFWKWFIILEKDNPEEIYLKRLRVIQTPLVSLYIHWINKPDNDRGPHDHPWAFLSFIVRGGYTEKFHKDPYSHASRTKTHKRFSLHRMGLKSAHRITYAKPNTITAIITGPRKRNWGFYVPDAPGSKSIKFVPWEVYDKAGFELP